MKTEKVVLAFIAIIVGLLVAFIGFFIYQSTRAIPSSKIPTLSVAKPTPTPKLAIFLTVTSPENESVTNKRTISLSGQTTPDATIVVTTNSEDQVVTPAANGNYSITVNLLDGVNRVVLTAIASNGDEVQKTLTITSSTEDF